MTPINDVPGELLLEFFSLAVYDPSVKRHWSDSVHPPLRMMLAITHVCSRWRYLALENSILWTGCIDMGRPIKCVEEIMLRSGTQPLHLTFFNPPPAQPNPFMRWHCTTYRPVPKVMDHPYCHRILSRTRSLQAILPSINCDKLFNYFKKYLWQMETISLEVESWSAVLRDDGLFDEEEWRVRVLSLKRCTIGLQPKALPFLEELRIAYPSGHAFPELATWLDLLAGLPQLRVFELIECFGPSEEEPYRASRDKIQMPKLERLVLKTSQPSQHVCTPLLDALALPPSCALTLGTPVQQWATSYKALLSALSKRYNAYDNALGNHLDLTIAGNAFTMQTQGSSAPGDTFIYFYFAGGGYRHTVSNSLTHAGLVYQTVLEAFRKPLASIRWLTLRIYVPEDEQINPFFNLRLLRKFPSLRSIDLNVESIFGGFPPIDSPSAFSPAPLDPRMFWFPSSAHRELVISRVNFGEGSSLHKLCLALMRHLKPRAKRWNSEGRIQTLSLRRCTGLRGWQLAKLEELIGIKYGVDIKCIDCEVMDVY